MCLGGLKNYVTTEESLTQEKYIPQFSLGMTTCYTVVFKWKTICLLTTCSSIFLPSGANLDINSVNETHGQENFCANNHYLYEIFIFYLFLSLIQLIKNNMLLSLSAGQYTTRSVSFKCNIRS